MSSKPSSHYPYNKDASSDNLTRKYKFKYKYDTSKYNNVTNENAIIMMMNKYLPPKSMFPMICHHAPERIIEYPRPRDSITLRG